MQGVPLVGSAVERGPDSYLGINGTVTRSNDFSGQIYIRTSSGYSKEFSWGRNGRYDVQLKRGYE